MYQVCKQVFLGKPKKSLSLLELTVMTTRTRFAPSPTGYLHVGGIRTAIFAYLLAKKTDGEFILRIEDTDKNREVEGSDQHIIQSLNALGLDFDEGPGKPGEFKPYHQSERAKAKIYQKYAEKLIQEGRAYADPYSPEEVQQFRVQAQAKKQPFLYRNHRPESPPAWDGAQPLRFKSNPRPYKWQDAIMGKMSAGPEVIDDFIIIKSDGLPTYNFAHIVDDHEMKITHVIRGQEFLASTPNYLNLYEALGIESPVLASAPPIMNAEGNKKLSKRDGAKDVLDYIRRGFLPEALLNFIVSLGWNDGTEEEIFSREELISKFSLARVQKAGAHFDERRLLWMNGSYIREKISLPELCDYSTGKNFFEIDYWPLEAATYDKQYRLSVLNLVTERLKFLEELPELTVFFFKDLPINPDLINNHKQLSKLSRPELKELLTLATQSLQDSDFSTEDITKRLNGLLEQTGQKPAVLFSLIRIATTQAPASPALAGSLVVLGKQRSLARLNTQLNEL